MTVGFIQRHIFERSGLNNGTESRLRTCAFLVCQHNSAMDQSLKIPDKVYVHVTQESHKEPVKFGQCLIDYFNGINTVSVTVEEDPKQSIIFLSQSDAITNGHMLLKHPSCCPVLEYSKEHGGLLAESAQYSHVSAAVSVLIQSADDHILLTRRNKQMRAFPGVWVTPGGYIDPGETAATAGLREVFEETGLDFRISEKDMKLVALWESVYPAVIAEGVPKRHNLVLYMLLKTDKSSKDMQHFSISFDEVDMVGWFPSAAINYLLTSPKEAYGDSLMMYESTSKNDLVHVDHSSFLSGLAEHHNSGSTQLPNERISTGSMFALEQWWNKFK